jgi:hypothetical protein
VEILYLGLDLFQTLLDNVADANYSAKCSIVDYGQVSDALERHHLHQIDQPIIRDAGLDFTGHQLIDRKCQQSVRIFRQAADDITLGDYPHDPTLLVDDGRSSDPIFGEQLDGRCHGLLRHDGNDTITLMPQDIRNLCFHVRLPVCEFPRGSTAGQPHLITIGFSLEYGEDGENRLKMCLFIASSVLESSPPCA